VDARVNGFVPFWGGGQVDAVRLEEEDPFDIGITKELEMK